MQEYGDYSVDNCNVSEGLQQLRGTMQTYQR